MRVAVSDREAPGVDGLPRGHRRHMGPADESRGDRGQGYPAENEPVGLQILREKISGKQPLHRARWQVLDALLGGNENPLVDWHPIRVDEKQLRVESR